MERCSTVGGDVICKDVTETLVTSILNEANPSTPLYWPSMTSKCLYAFCLQVAYTPGHLDLNLRHALLSTPSKPPLEVLHDEDLPAGGLRVYRRGIYTVYPEFEW